jgi:hypothetical protein
MERQEVKLGSFWVSKNRSGVIRKVIGFWDVSVRYREYATIYSHAIEGQMLPCSLKSWGVLVEERNADYIVPKSERDRLDLASDERNKESGETLLMALKQLRQVSGLLTQEDDMTIFHIEQDVRDLEEKVMGEKINKQEISVKLLEIADKLSDFQNDAREPENG